VCSKNSSQIIKNIQNFLYDTCHIPLFTTTLLIELIPSTASACISFLKKASLKQVLDNIRFYIIIIGVVCECVKTCKGINK